MAVNERRIGGTEQRRWHPHEHLPRLDAVWIQQPVFYIITCTKEREPVLANNRLHAICCEVWNNCEQLYGWGVGRYVLMPDHAPFFCFPMRDKYPLNTFIGKWKEWTAKYAHSRYGICVPFWQPEFFDYVLRSWESYEQKWQYVRENPLRAGLVTSVEDWPYQGEIHLLSEL